MYIPLIPTKTTVCPLPSLSVIILFTLLPKLNPFVPSHFLFPITTWYCSTLLATFTKSLLDCNSPTNLTAMLVSPHCSCPLTNWLTSVTLPFKPRPGNASNPEHLPNCEV